MSLICNFGGRSWRLRCLVIVAAKDWSYERLLESNGYVTEIEASLLKWAWYSVQAYLFAGAEGMNGSL